MSKMNVEQVIFVGGSGRSGTTLVCELLDLHSEAASIFEVWPLITLLDHLRKEQAPDKELGELNLRGINYSLSPAAEFNWRFRREELLYAWSAKVKATLESGQPLHVAIRHWADYLHRLQMTRDGSTRIIHKTPALAAYLPELWRLWPSGRFLHIIRDPRDVVASYLAQEWGPTDVRSGVEWYCARAGAAIRDGRGDTRYMEVKMEDLVKNPREVLDQIQNWAGLSPETEGMLTGMQVRPDVVNYRKNQLDPKVARWIYEESVSRIPALGELYSL